MAAASHVLIVHARPKEISNHNGSECVIAAGLLAGVDGPVQQYQTTTNSSPTGSVSQLPCRLHCFAAPDIVTVLPTVL